MFGPGAYTLRTLPMKRLLAELRSYIFSNVPGAYVWGMSRAGKTFAFESVIPRLTNRLDEPVFTHIYSANQYFRTTDNKMWTDILQSLNHPLAQQGYAIDKFWRLVGCLAERASLNSTNQALFVIDNAEDWTPTNYHYLKGLFNVLKQRNINLCFVSVGTEELHNWVQSYKGHQAPHLRGRFFVTYHNFTGLKGSSEVQHALKQIDTGDARENIGPGAATSTYVPIAFAHGFRLSTYAPLVWEVFKDIRAKNADDQWPMQYFTSTVEVLLMDVLAPRDTACLEVTEEDVARAIGASHMP